MLDVGVSGDLDYVRHAIWNLFKTSLHRLDKENSATLFCCEAQRNYKTSPDCPSVCGWEENDWRESFKCLQVCKQTTMQAEHLKTHFPLILNSKSVLSNRCYFKQIVQLSEKDINLRKCWNTLSVNLPGLHRRRCRRFWRVLPWCSY